MSTPLAKDKMDAMLRELWQRKLPMIKEHLSILQRAAETLSQATLTTPLRNEAAISAHKLAGSLGMFGFPEGTRFAREIEQMLDSQAAPLPEAFAALVRQLTGSVAL